MIWSSFNDYIPIIGASLCMALAISALYRGTAPHTGKWIFTTMIVVVALSIALYWSDLPETAQDGGLMRRKPPFVAHLGLWVLKTKAAIAGVGIVGAQYLTGQAIRTIFYVLLTLAITSGSLMAAALLDL